MSANRAWHEANGTYTFALGLGAVIVLYGLMLALHPWLPQVASIGSLLVFVMSLVTLSFLVTTPEAWVPNLGDADARLPVPERGRASCREGRHHDGRRDRDDGRFGESVSAAQPAGRHRGRRFVCSSSCLGRRAMIKPPATASGGALR